MCIFFFVLFFFERINSGFQSSWILSQHKSVFASHSPAAEAASISLKWHLRLPPWAPLWLSLQSLHTPVSKEPPWSARLYNGECFCHLPHAVPENLFTGFRSAAENTFSPGLIPLEKTSPWKTLFLILNSPPRALSYPLRPTSYPTVKANLHTRWYFSRFWGGDQ